MTLSKWLLTAETTSVSRTLYTWGDDSDGALGFDDRVNRSSPTSIPSKNFTDFELNLRNGWGIDTSKNLWAWGFNTSGQLGTGDAVSRSSPVNVASSVNKVMSNKSGSHSGYIDTVGRLYLVGANGSQQLGGNDAITRSLWIQVGSNYSPTPTYLAQPSSYTNVGAMSLATFASDTNGVLYGWGATNAIISPAVMPLPTELTSLYTEADEDTWITYSGINYSWIMVASSGNMGMAVRNDHKLFVWGFGTQLPTYGTDSIFTGRYQMYRNNFFDGYSIAQIQSSSGTAGVLLTNGNLYMWGSNTWGILTTGDRIDRSAPVQITIPDNGTCSAFSISDQHALMIISNNTVGNYKLAAIGRNAEGQLGQLDVVGRSSLVYVSTDYSWAFVSATSSGSVALRTDGGLFAFGAPGTGGRWGLNNVVSYSSPVQLTTLRTEAIQDAWVVYSGQTVPTWTQVDWSLYNGVGIKSDGSLWVWGAGAFGSLGMTEAIGVAKVDQYFPIKIDNNSWAQVSAGDSFTVALKTDNTLWGWGVNNRGQLGQSDTLNRSSPVQIAANIVSVSAGDEFWLGLDSVGRLYGCGLNTAYQLGIEMDNISRSASVQIGSSSWSMIAAQSGYALGKTVDGLTLGWGNHATASVTALGLGTMLTALSRAVGITTIYDSATAQTTYLAADTLATARSWSQISIGDQGGGWGLHLASDSKMYVWGYNNNGNLGLGDNDQPRFSPILLGTSSWSKVSAGYIFSLGINTSGQLFSWGSGANGRLGTLDLVNRSSPVQIGVGTSFTQISAGLSFAAAIDSTGALWAWGGNAGGQLGLNDRIARSEPTLINNTSSWYFVSAGYANIYAIDINRSLWVVGSNTNGELGLGDRVNRSNLTQLTGNSWNSISAGQNHAAAIATTGALFTWGDNTSGVLGLNISGTAGRRSSPVQLGVASWSLVSAGIQNTLALDTTGVLFSVGLNADGQLGTNDRVNRSNLTQIGTETYDQVSLAVNGSVVGGIRKTNKQLYLWGPTLYYRWGSWTSTARSSPIFVPSASENYTMFSKSTGSPIRTYVKRRGDNLTFAAGVNSAKGQMGTGDTVNKSTWTQIGTDNYTQIKAGRSTTVFLRSDGSIFTVGDGAEGALGNGGTTSRSSLVQVSTSSYSFIGAGRGVSAAIKTTGRLFSWGGGPGSKGDGSNATDQNSPVFVPNVQDTFNGNFKLENALGHALFIRKDGLVFSAGLNTAGQLGLKSTINRSYLTQLGSSAGGGGEGSSSFTMVATGLSHSVGIKVDGGIVACGLNASGQIGNGNTTNQSAMVTVGTSSWTTIHAGRSSTVALKTNYRFYGWGDPNGYPFNSAVDANSPVFIRGVSESWTAFATGINHILALRADGRLYAAGLNANGELGLGDVVSPRSRLTQIGSSSWKFVAAGTNISAGIQTNNTLWTWGTNAAGQLGNNSTINRSAPVQVGTSSWLGVSVGGSGAVGILATNELYVWGAGTAGRIGDSSTISRSNPLIIGSLKSWVKVSTSANNITAALYKN